MKISAFWDICGPSYKLHVNDQSRPTPLMPGIRQANLRQQQHTTEMILERRHTLHLEFQNEIYTRDQISSIDSPLSVVNILSV